MQYLENARTSRIWFFRKWRNKSTPQKDIIDWVLIHRLLWSIMVTIHTMALFLWGQQSRKCNLSMTQDLIGSLLSRAPVLIVKERIMIQLHQRQQAQEAPQLRQELTELQLSQVVLILTRSASRTRLVHTFVSQVSSTSLSHLRKVFTILLTVLWACLVI